MILKASRTDTTQENGQTMEPLDFSTLVATTTKKKKQTKTYKLQAP